MKTKWILIYIVCCWYLKDGRGELIERKTQFPDRVERIKTRLADKVEQMGYQVLEFKVFKDIKTVRVKE